VLDSVFAHKAIGIEDDRDEHVSWELVDLKEVQQDDEELVESVLNLREGMSGEVFTVIILNPRNAQLEQQFAGERGVRAEFESFHDKECAYLKYITVQGTVCVQLGRG